VWATLFFTRDSDVIPGTATPSGLPRCLECGHTIDEHRPEDQAVGARRRRGTKTPEDLLDAVRALRNGRPLNEILAQMGARFLASDWELRSIGPALHFRDAGRDLVAELRDIHACPQDARRPVLMTTGIFGTGKTVLLLRALDAIPPTGPTLDVARVYITFDFATRYALAPGGRACFNAALLLRVFHAALTTLGPHLSFYEFLHDADWVKFVDPTTYLPLLADALGVQTLAIAVDRITNGVSHQAPNRADLEAQTVTQLCDLFRWADIKRVQPPSSPRSVIDGTTAAVVIPILSCMHPRYARAAQRSDDDRELVWLHADLAPSVNELVAPVDPSSRPALAARFRELFYRQQYSACGGHFWLCAEVHGSVGDLEISPSGLRCALEGPVRVLVNCLTLEPYRRDLATMVAQAVGGMSFKELQARHGEAAAAPLDPFFQSDTMASNIPLAVVLSRGAWVGRTPRPLNKVFALWTKAADGALQQSTAEGMRRGFEAMVVHGLALRWAAFLAPTPSTPLRPTPPAAPPFVGFCAGRGAYLDPAGNLCWIELSDVAVCEPCTYTYVAADTFPPPGGITPSTYTLTSASAADPVVGDGGCVTVSSLPKPVEGFSHVYFTVRSHQPHQPASNADALERLMPAMPSDAPCVHVLWTARPYTPEPSALDALLRKLRASRGDGAAASGPCLDIVACVNVQDCMTPSLAWTLTCAGF
jgi:hypothetical protein